MLWRRRRETRNRNINRQSLPAAAGHARLRRVATEQRSDETRRQVRAVQFVAVEVKRPGKKPTPEQMAFLDQVNELGGLGLWVSDVLELDARLKIEGIEP